MKIRNLLKVVTKTRPIVSCKNILYDCNNKLNKISLQSPAPHIHTTFYGYLAIKTGRRLKQFDYSGKGGYHLTLLHRDNWYTALSFRVCLISDRNAHYEK